MGLVQEDWIGMRTLHEAGKLEFRECPGNHMHFNLEWCASSHAGCVDSLLQVASLMCTAAIVPGLCALESASHKAAACVQGADKRRRRFAALGLRVS